MPLPSSEHLQYLQQDQQEQQERQEYGNIRRESDKIYDSRCSLDYDDD